MHEIFDTRVEFFSEFLLFDKKSVFLSFKRGHNKFPRREVEASRVQFVITNIVYYTNIVYRI